MKPTAKLVQLLAHCLELVDCPFKRKIWLDSFFD
jgi:hypothetical protein